MPTHDPATDSADRSAWLPMLVLGIVLLVGSLFCLVPAVTLIAGDLAVGSPGPNASRGIGAGVSGLIAILAGVCLLVIASRRRRQQRQS